MSDEEEEEDDENRIAAGIANNLPHSAPAIEEKEEEKSSKKPQKPQVFKPTFNCQKSSDQLVVDADQLTVTHAGERPTNAAIVCTKAFPSMWITTTHFKIKSSKWNKGKGMNFGFVSK